MFRKPFTLIFLASLAFAQNKVAPDKEAAMKADLAGQLDGMKKQAQVMVDSVCSEKIMEKYRPEMKKFCYDSPKYDTCLKQLGSKYPTVAR